MEISKKYTSQIDSIKENIHRSWLYFKPNYDRFNEFRKFVFETTLKADELTLMQTVGKPNLEFNILEAYISRLLGEFSKQEPDIEVSSDNQDNADPLMIKVVEQHLRHTLNDHLNTHFRYEIYKDILSGGFSVGKIFTEYAHPMSMHQVIRMDRVFDPTLCGFDHISKYSHKGDGRFCFELFPMAKEIFEEEYPNVDVKQLSIKRDVEGFRWCYYNDKTPTIIVAEYYEKKKKSCKIVQVRNGEVMPLDKYNKMLDEWDAVEQPPVILGKPRTTEIETICRYKMVDNAIFDYTETDFRHFPLVFIDGNSIMVKNPTSGDVRQVTRPYVYHAKGAQRMKNYAGISWANDIENTIQHKFIIKKEALPKEEDWLEAIKDVQRPSNIVVNAFYEQNPDQPIPDPIREIVKMPMPPETAQAFTATDSLVQNILGSYDASLGINNNQLSGIAIVEGASQSNSTAMPYIVGVMQGLSRMAEIYIDLLPKYYTLPGKLPTMDSEGQKSSVLINQDEGIDMFYDSNSLNVTVKAGASFQVQKSRTIMMVKEMMGMSPLFAQFMAEKGLTFILDNMEGRNIDQLKKMTEEWQKEMQEQKQAAQQQQQQNPVLLKLQHESQKLQSDTEIQNKELDIRAVNAQIAHESAIAKAEAEKFKAGAEVAIKQMDVTQKHHNARIDMAHRHAEAIAKHHREKQK